MNFREVLFIVLGMCADDLVCTSMYIFVKDYFYLCGILECI